MYVERTNFSRGVRLSNTVRKDAISNGVRWKTAWRPVAQARQTGQDQGFSAIAGMARRAL